MGDGSRARWAAVIGDAEAREGVAGDDVGPTALRFTTADTGKATKASMWDYVDVCKDIRVVVMIFQYSACFGCELVMNNTLATHFHDYFGVDLVAAPQRGRATRASPR